MQRRRARVAQRRRGRRAAGRTGRSRGRARARRPAPTRSAPRDTSRAPGRMPAVTPSGTDSRYPSLKAHHFDRQRRLAGCAEDLADFADARAADRPTRSAVRRPGRRGRRRRQLGAVQRLKIRLERRCRYLRTMPWRAVGGPPERRHPIRPSSVRASSLNWRPDADLHQAGVALHEAAAARRRPNRRRS